MDAPEAVRHKPVADPSADKESTLKKTDAPGFSLAESGARDDFRSGLEQGSVRDHDEFGAMEYEAELEWYDCQNGDPDSAGPRSSRQEPCNRLEDSCEMPSIAAASSSSWNVVGALEEDGEGTRGMDATGPPAFVGVPAGQRAQDWAVAVASSSSKAVREEFWLPWEDPIFRPIFESPGERLRGTGKLDLKPMGLQFAELMSAEPQSCPAKFAPDPVFVARRIRKVSFKAEVQESRNLALLKLNTILSLDLQATQLGATLASKAADLCQSSELEMSLVDAFATKATSTLEKRASYLSRMTSWMLRNRNESPLRFTEDGFYAYVCHLRESGAGATSAQATIEAVNFWRQF